jgi:hypothetical protein
VAASWFRFRLEVLRAATVRSAGLNTPVPAAATPPLGVCSADKWDVSDGERVAAAAVSASITARFLVRTSTLTRAIAPNDRVRVAGVTYDVTGNKEPTSWRGEPLPPRRYREISAFARTDRAP